MKSVVVLLVVVAILLAALWFAGERGLVELPYPPIWPWLRENVTITVVKSQGQCVVVDAPSRLITKAGRTVTWKIRARKDECAAHEVSIQFEGDDPTGNEKKKAKATDGLEIKATSKTTPKEEKLYIYQILLASDPMVMGRGTLALCPYWPCRSAEASAADATITTDPGGPITPSTTLVPDTRIPASPAPVSTPPPQ